MSTTPVEKQVPRAPSGRAYTALGYALRAVKALPAPLRERIFDSASGGVSASLPPFPDLVRLLEAAGGLPNGKRWQQRLLAERPELRKVRVRDVRSDAGGRLRARLYLPPKSAPTPSAAFVWVHGGAFVVGGPDQEEAHWPSLELAAAGIPVLSVDYRMCLGGVHYPAPQEDVLTGWLWAAEHADELGVTVDQLHLGGGSAGGCLVASATLRLRDEGGPLPASLYLGYPVLQADLPPASPQVEAELASVKVVTPAWVRGMVEHWAGNAPTTDPYVAPGLADLKGLPPVYVLSCGHDTLRRASEPFARRLAEAGVPVWHDLFETAEHAPLDRPGTLDGDHAVQQLRTWLTGGVSAMARQAP